MLKLSHKYLNMGLTVCVYVDGREESDGLVETL